jgi:superfamily II DNA or RNA helicase
VSSDVLALDLELADLRATVVRLRAENERLLRLLELSPRQAAAPGPAQSGLFERPPGPVHAKSDSTSKVAFFREMFACRSDVYATRWENNRTGRAGWVPAVPGGWRRGSGAGRLDYLPLTDEVLTAHLSGEIHVGLYPLLRDNRCHWVAADFDGSAAMLDALSYVKAARALGAPAALEVSRSGVGAHVWTFFTDAVPAATARRLALGLLREAMTLRGEMDLSSYDRLFPSQDTLPGPDTIGNLIAAPLQGQCRRRGATVFLDLSTLEPQPDQWAYLSTVARLTPKEVARLADRATIVQTGSQVDRLARSSATRISPPVPTFIRGTLGAGLALERAALPAELLATLKHAASMPNPLFYERERRRLSTYQLPRFLRCYSEDLEHFVVPRGMRASVEKLVAEAGSRLQLTDERPDPEPLPFVFAADLGVEQSTAADTLAQHELGMLVAPPGAGKTVIACALIARHAVPTLVLVDRKPLLDQWRARLLEFLGVTAGQLGGGKDRRTGVVDVATLQTVAKRTDLAELSAAYGLVIVDECHHLPAVAFEQAVRQIPVRRWLGLTATPYRRDGLDQLIVQQCGPVRHRITHHERDTLDGGQQLRRDLLVKPTGFRYVTDDDLSRPGAIQAVYRALVDDTGRNEQVVDDVQTALAAGRHCLVLTQWTRHVELLADALRHLGHDPVVLRGGLGVRARAAALARLVPTEGDPPLLAVATGSYLGEGFDCPALDTLFLVAPIAFKGRLVQYVGRIVRPHPGKTTAQVHDYHDVNVPVLAHSLNRRAPGYTSLGFPDPR